MSTLPATGHDWPPQPEPAPAAVAHAPGGELGDEGFRAAARQIFKGTAGELGQVATRDQARAIAAERVAAWAEQQARAGGVLAPPQAQAALVRAVLDEQFGLGPLQPYLDDPQVENIDINGPDQVWVTLRDGRRLAGRPVASSDGELMEMVRTWGLREGQTPREFSATNPLLNAALTDITLEELCQPEYGTLSPGLAHFLSCAVRAYKNMIVTGGVDAGKTTLLRALASAIDPGERIATLESEYELYLHRLPGRHHDVVAMEARQANTEGAGAIILHDLIPQALRLNPRRIIVGEVRDTEIRPMLEAMNSGQEGSLATIHANSADEVFGRILMLAQRGQLTMSPEVIHLEVGMARPFVPHIRKDPATHQRFVSEVIEVVPPADGALPYRNRVCSPGPDGRAVPDHSLSPEAMADLMAAGFSPDALAWSQL